MESPPPILHILILSIALKIFTFTLHSILLLPYTTTKLLSEALKIDVQYALANTFREPVRILVTKYVLRSEKVHKAITYVPLLPLVLFPSLPALIEILAEIYVCNTNKEALRVANLESTASAMKTIVAIVLFYIAPQQSTCFYHASVAYSIIIATGMIYIAHTTPALVVFEPTAEQTVKEAEPSREIIILGPLLAQEAFKLALNEGDRIVLTAYATESVRGTYSFVFNYASLVVRLLFTPINEALRVTLPGNNQAANEQLVSALLSLYTMLFSLGLAFGVPSLPYILSWIPKWSHAAPVFVRFGFLLPLMAINGVLESVVHTTATGTVLLLSSGCLTTSFLVFCGSAWIIGLDTASDVVNAMIIAGFVRLIGNLLCIQYYGFSITAWNLSTFKWMIICTMIGALASVLGVNCISDICVLAVVTAAVALALLYYKLLDDFRKVKEIGVRDGKTKQKSR